MIESAAVANSSNFGAGGGIYVYAGTATLDRVAVYGNEGQAGNGGGIYSGGTLTITNSTVSGNSLGGQNGKGGGLFADHGATLTNVTFANNEAAQGTEVYFTDDYAGSFGLKNVITDGPSAENCVFEGPLAMNAFNLSNDGTCGFGSGRDNVDVKLGPLDFNGGATFTHMPADDSPAVDGGTNDGCPSVDQRGAARPVGGVCDVGSVEVGGALPTPPVTPSPTASPTESPSPVSTASPTPTTSLSPTPSGQTPSPSPSGLTPTPSGQTITPTPGGPTATPTPSGQTPAPTPSGQTATPTPASGRIHGDVDCSGDAGVVDSLKVLRHDAGLSVAQAAQCPPFGTTFGGVLWSDVDCTVAVNPVDSLKLLRFDAGLSVSQEAGCPLIGSVLS
jgi:hypothetical protein